MRAKNYYFFDFESFTTDSIFCCQSINLHAQNKLILLFTIVDGLIYFDFALPATAAGNTCAPVNFTDPIHPLTSWYIINKQIIKNKQKKKNNTQMACVFRIYILKGRSKCQS